MNNILIVILNFILIFMGSLVSAQAIAFTGTDVMNQNEERRKIDDVHSSATLVTGGGGGAAKTKQFTWWRKLAGDQVHFNTLTRFHSPAEIRGEGILFLEHSGDNNEVLIYLPNFKKIRRVESQQQSGSFMGSELSYSDIATPHVQDYKQTLLREELCPASGTSTVTCFVVESLPISDEVRERTGYSKTINWVRKDNFMVVRADSYDLEGQLLKKMEASEIKVVDPAQNKWMSHKVRVENTKTGRYTLLIFKEVKVNQGIPDSTFTQQNLSRGQ